MRTGALILIAMALMALGCSNESNPVAQYGNETMHAYSAGKSAGEVADLTQIKAAIASYYASNERYPASIEEISTVMRIEIDPAKYAYNPATGVIVSK